MKYLPIFFAFLAIRLSAYEPSEFNSGPVDWGALTVDDQSVVLTGVFSAHLEPPLKWKTLGAGKGPTGSPFHMWAIVDFTGIQKGMLLIMDVDVSKVPPSEQGTFVSTFLSSFRRSGIAAMEKKGFETVRFEISDYAAGGNYAKKAFSDFRKEALHQYNVTYAFPLTRIYIVGFDGDSAGEPAWFSELLAHFEKH